MLDETRVFRPQFAAHMLLNRCAALTVIARETAEAFADHDPPALGVRVGQRVALTPLKRGFAALPSNPEDWVRAPEKRLPGNPGYTARLTIDVTPELRGRIKVTAFTRGLTVADMLRVLLEREFPARPSDDAGGAS